MLHITLGAARPAPAGDQLDRDRTGFAEDMSETELYNAGRGAWVLGARADREPMPCSAMPASSGRRLMLQRWRN